MSVERELLKTIYSYVSSGYWVIDEFETQIEDTVKEIEKLLAQPEQEPVGIVKTIGGYPDDSVHTVEWLCKYKDIKDGDKLIILKDDK